MNADRARQQALTAKRAHLCCYSGCRTIVLGETFCWRHRPPEPAGEWSEMARIKGEPEKQR